MSTGAIVAIAVGAVIVLAIILVLGRVARGRRLERRRGQARELRQEATSRAQRAEQVRATADEATARAERSKAEADEQAAKARRESVEAERESERAAEEILAARTRHDQAREVDPDAPDSAQREAAHLDAQRGNGAGEEVGAEQHRSSSAGGSRH
jgi:uncharacterized membrane protein YhiD involved in acid resistance